MILDIREGSNLISPAHENKDISHRIRAYLRGFDYCADSTYKAAEAAKHVGEAATIIDTVAGVHQSGKGNIFLNMGGKHNETLTLCVSLQLA